MKKTALYSKHLALNARMVTYAGFEMPLQYQRVTQEHQGVRNQLGLFDVSHMGEFILEGPHALDLIQKVTTNDAARLKVGQAQYSCMTHPQGGILDDLILYRLDPARYMLVLNAANLEKDWNWLKQQDEWQTPMRDASDQTALLAVQGPKAEQVLQGLTDKNLSDISSYHFNRGRLATAEDVLLSRTGYTGSGGFELYLPREEATSVWEHLTEAGSTAGIRACGLAARDTLRLEMGYCLYGNEIDENISPLEARLGWITRFNKAFVGAEVLKKQKAEGVQRKLIGFEVIGQGIPRKGYELQDAQQNPIGRVTSGAQSPSLGKGIGLGYVKVDFAKPGTPINVQIRGKAVPAKIAALPFYKGTH